MDRDYMRKYGHPFKKPYREEDVGAYVFPERDNLCGKGLMLYRRYEASKDKTYCSMSFCSCNHYGKLCAKCLELNISDFYGLEVPLCQEDTTFLVRHLVKEGWKVPQVYQWLDFWVRKHGKYPDYRVTKFVFWHYDSFGMGGSVHKFFRYLFNFVREEKYKSSPYRWEKNPSFISDGPRSAMVNTVDVTLQLSMRVYGGGDEFQEMATVERGERNTKYTRVSWGPMRSLYLKRLEQQSRGAFRKVVSEIQNEVAFRPNMVGMEEARDDFLVHCC